MISVYNKLTQIPMGPRQIEYLDNYWDIINHGRKDPAWFIENFLCVELTDYQKWLINSSWTKRTVCWVCSRSTGKSFMIALYIMTRAILFSNIKIYIMSNTGQQAKDTFTKMKDIANNNILTVKNDGCIFKNELMKAVNSDGFVGGGANGDNMTCELYNKTTIQTLVGNAKNIVGKRSNLSVYDEAAIIPEEFFTRAEPFTATNAEFMTGKGVDMSVYPKMLPNQNIYLSSAGDTSSHLYVKYRECAKRMIMGYDDCFVADISCEIPLNLTIKGKPHAPLFTRAEVEAAMKSNPYRALREYYNLFDQTGGLDVLVPRDVILRSEKPFRPVFSNHDRDAIYGIFYDPAHQADNSFVLITEYKRSENEGWKMRVVNGINLLRVLPNGDKKPMRSTEQLDWVHQLMLDYNGRNAEEWVNIHMAVDPGAGGGGMLYSDFLIQEWADTNGKLHHGVIDMNDEASKLERDQFPFAIEGVLSLPSASKFKNDQYAALIEMMTNEHVIFPSTLPKDGVLKMEDGSEVELTPEEIRALVEIDLVKEEMLLMRKVKTDAGNIKYELRADKKKTGHDDRAYTMSMACHYLQQLRRADEFKGEGAVDTDMSRLINSIGGHKSGFGGTLGRSSAWSGMKSPFGR